MRRIALEKGMDYINSNNNVMQLNATVNYVTIKYYFLFISQTVEEFRSELLERLKRPENRIYQWHNRNPYGYDATWAVALMLNRSVDILKTKRFADGNTRRLEDFTYDDNEMALMFLDLFKDTDFPGVSVRMTRV